MATQRDIEITLKLNKYLDFVVPILYEAWKEQDYIEVFQRAQMLVDKFNSLRSEGVSFCIYVT